MNFAIIVAAGNGKRFGSKTPKQFLELCQKPVIFHVLERFEACSSIDEIILVLSAAEIENFRKLSASYLLPKLKTVVTGGETRARSVQNGLQAIKHARSADIVVVHDGARPLVSASEITATIEKAEKTGAAILVTSVTDTIKEVASSEKILKTIDRTKLRRALTPQCFRYELLQQAFLELNDSISDATDESFLIEKLGVEVATIEGSAQNIKITMPDDLKLAEFYLSLKKLD